ncbi:Rv3235 family protein [Streptomyces sp. NPDC088354]|uniref:Rv3235 family protein n=1 Tax=unclassified Streptomyces TaxID=2593676 RepID=UPI0029BF7D75|nr:Rv3235 family protein [Streptomyces sp. MI02-7b]MDX3078267.1 Rv3235 family protein [Streptomyces sp. MI02-7b]
MPVTTPSRSAIIRAHNVTALPPHIWFAGRLLDVLTGRRPVAGLAGRVRPEAYDHLWNLVNTRTDWAYVARGHTPRLLRRPHVSPSSDGRAVEVAAAVVLAPDIVRALAFRLERDGTRPGGGPGCWRCTAVEAR